jgi:hypothetical protein
MRVLVSGGNGGAVTLSPPMSSAMLLRSVRVVTTLMVSCETVERKAYSDGNHKKFFHGIVLMF